MKMLLNEINTYANANNIFHVSEEPGIKEFAPRPSPSYYPGFKNDVVFGVCGKLLHNYLLPRDCPRVTWYQGPNTTDEDKLRFLDLSSAKHVVAVEKEWYLRIKATTLYCYQFKPDNFKLLDACAGYYVSVETERPINVITVNDIMAELISHDVELRFLPSLIELAGQVSQSSLNFSLIRMRNAK